MEAKPHLPPPTQWVIIALGGREKRSSHWGVPEVREDQDTRYLQNKCALLNDPYPTAYCLCYTSLQQNTFNLILLVMRCIFKNNHLMLSQLY